MTSKIDFHFDGESRSFLDLKEVGTVKYCLHPSTEVTLWTWTFGRTGHIRTWRRGQPIPAELIHVAESPHLYNFNAFNVFFDFCLWTLTFSRLVPTMVRPKIEDLTDTMALSSHFRCGGSLDAVAAMMRLPFSKDKEGRRLMLKQCKPDRYGKFIELTPDEWAKFEHYGVTDTRILRDVYYMLPPLPAAERYAFEWTLRRNLRGIRVDMTLLHLMDGILKQEVPKLIAEFNQCVSYQFTLKSPKAKDWFKQWYPWIENMQKDTVRDMLKSKDPVPPHVRRALEIKDLAGSSSIAKVDTALSQQVFGRIYGVLSYHFAQTKRWAGRGIQIQNFPRPDDKRPDRFDFDMNVHDITPTIKAMLPLKDPANFIKNILRRIWIPDEGMEFLCGDFSKVEPTTLFWLAGLGPIPKKWYEEMAAAIYNKPIDQIGKDSLERQIGKAACLSCIYGVGWEKFQATVYKDTGIELDEATARTAVSAFRAKYPEIAGQDGIWKNLERAFRKAIGGEGSVLCDGKIHVMPMLHRERGVTIRLPSGSFLYYHRASLGVEQYEEEYTLTNALGVSTKHTRLKTREVIKYVSDEGGILGEKKLYGGLLTEHITSATSRDILLPAMYRLEQANFDVLNVIHDEIWGQAAPGRAEEFKSLMCVKPSWCDMEIGADLKCGVRYLK